MTELLQFDQYLFHLINSDWQNAFLDMVMPYWRHKLTWFPLYLFLFTFLLVNYKLKGLYFILALTLTVGIADSTSSHLIKKNVKRIRPCNNEDFKAEVHLLIPCGSGYSFTSSHASNHFALAGFLILTLARKHFWLKALLSSWAASIAYGQVYVGVHYPLDVIGGAILGFAIAWSLSMGYKHLQQIRIEEFYTCNKL